MLGHRDPYIEFMKDDLHESDGVVQVDLTEDSITRRIWEYDQNDAIRYFARINPLGSEESFLEQRAKRFGEALYTAFDDFLDGQEDVFMYRERGRKKVGGEPGAAARQTLYSLGRGSEQVFYRAALEAVEKEAFDESLAKAKSEI